MMFARLVLALALVLPVAAAAQVPAAPARLSMAQQMLAGSWALRIDGTVVFRFDLEVDGAGWRGTWTKPTAFVTDGAQFGSMRGPAVAQRSISGKAIGEWAELAFGDARPGAVPDIFRFRLTAPDRAEMLYTETGFAPFVLERVDSGTVAGPWTAGTVLRRPGVQPGALVTYNANSPVTPPAQPTPRAQPTRPPPEVQGPPASTDRPPAVIGR